MNGCREILAVIFFAFASVTSNAEDRYAEVDLPAVVAAAAQALERSHYTQRKLDAGMGWQILESYVTSLDHDKLFFTQGDIDQIRNSFGSGLSDNILLGNLNPVKGIFALFKQRVDERLAKIGELLKEPYEFNEDRTIILNRAKESWPADSSEADRIWKDWIENERLTVRQDTGDSESENELISRRYHELQAEVDGLDDQDVVRIFLEAVAQTYDPHSEYLGSSDLNQFKINTRLTISGIGAEVRMKDGYAIIDRIFRGGPADRCGKLHVGDKILAVAQSKGAFVKVLHLNFDKFTDLVLGKNGSTVRLQYISSRTKKPLKWHIVSLVRGEVRLREEEAQAELIEVHLPGEVQKLGWISIPTFYGGPDYPSKSPSVTDDVAALLGRLKQEGMQGLVIDLRNNRGGAVDEALKMTGLFISEGPIVQLKDPYGEIQIIKKPLGKVLFDGPMIVLQNKLTASASEIFSAAIQDHRRAPVVGDSSSFGKGTVQAVVGLDHFIDGSDDLSTLAGALKITMQKVYRVTGQSTQLKGVTTDLRIPSLTEYFVPSEEEEEHRLAYDEIAPVDSDFTRNSKPLFLDELRRRSVARIQDNPVFQDLAAENALVTKRTEKNLVSLNEKIRKRDSAELARLREKEVSDRKNAWAHDRNTYFQLRLPNGDLPRLILIDKKRETGGDTRTGSLDEISRLPLAPSGDIPGKIDVNTLTENDAITSETLNILLDLIHLTKARQAEKFARTP